MDGVSDQMTRTYWFHCGRCGSLFQALPGLREDRYCSHCGFDPSTGVMHAGERRALPSATKPTQPISKPTRERSTRPNEVEGSGRKPKRKTSLTVMIAGGWIATMLCIILIAKWLWPDPDQSRPPEQERISLRQEVASQSQEVANGKFLSEEGPASLEMFSKFLMSGTPEERNQYVLMPLQTAVRMDRFDRDNPMPKIDPADLRQLEVEVLKLPDGRVGMYSLWQHQNGQKYDTLMLKEEGEWKIDWEHFVRYSSEPFSMFISGNGDAEGDFRLLVRERLAEERKGLDTMSLVFYAPRFGRPQEEGQESPEVSVSRRSPEGRMLQAALQREMRGEKVFGMRTRAVNPDQMARVQVRLQRSGAETERTFRVVRVMATHWFSLEDPGLKASEADP